MFTKHYNLEESEEIRTEEGRGLVSRPETSRDPVCWNDTELAFNSCIRTGVISNLRHKVPASFLQDHFKLFRPLKKEAAAKVNAAFGELFEIAKDDNTWKYIKPSTT